MTHQKRKYEEKPNGNFRIEYNNPMCNAQWIGSTAEYRRQREKK